MIISLILVAVSLSIFFILKERFDGWPPAFRYGVFTVVSLVIAIVLTMEFFIYVHERLLEFLQAVAGIHPLIILVVFIAIALGTWRGLLVIGAINRESFQQFLHDTFVPKAKETLKEVARTGRLGWRGLKLSFRSPFRRKPPQADQSPPDSSRDKS